MAGSRYFQICEAIDHSLEAGFQQADVLNGFLRFHRISYDPLARSFLSKDVVFEFILPNASDALPLLPANPFRKSVRSLFRFRLQK